MINNNCRIYNRHRSQASSDKIEKKNTCMLLRQNAHSIRIELRLTPLSIELIPTIYILTCDSDHVNISILIELATEFNRSRSTRSELIILIHPQKIHWLHKLLLKYIIVTVNSHHEFRVLVCNMDSKMVWNPPKFDSYLLRIQKTIFKRSYHSAKRPVFKP